VALLAHCSLFVTHGGFNSAKEALAAGVPMVICPIAGHQPYCAKRCDALGLARVIAPSDRHPESIRAAARAALSTPSYRHRAARVRQEIHALPPVDAAITIVEQLAHQHPRIHIPT
jgi:N-glycosyltransferase